MEKNIERYTRVNKYTDIKEILSQIETNDYDIPTLIQFCDEQIASLEKKAAKAKETAAAKKLERDELCDAVYAALTTEPQTREDIAAQITIEDASVAKVGARLTKLVNANAIGKDNIKVKGPSGKNMSKMVYFLIEE